RPLRRFHRAEHAERLAPAVAQGLDQPEPPHLGVPADLHLGEAALERLDHVLADVQADISRVDELGGDARLRIYGIGRDGQWPAHRMLENGSRVETASSSSDRAASSRIEASTIAWLPVRWNTENGPSTPRGVAGAGVRRRGWKLPDTGRRRWCGSTNRSGPATLLFQGSRYQPQVAPRLPWLRSSAYCPMHEPSADRK